MKYFLTIFVIFMLLANSCTSTPTNDDGNTNPKLDPLETVKLVVPADNKIYHAAFPDFGGTEDVVTTGKVTNFEYLADKEITWVYFSNNWSDGIQFPTNDVNQIKNAGKVPFIRMMPRSNFDEGGPDPNYTMDNFLNGMFDVQLKQWAIGARNVEIPLLVEFGTEVNGKWFPWNAKWNQGESIEYGSPSLYDGMEKFRDVYRHIINICKEQGANNITWFYHINAGSDPNNEWNNAKDYYPGDDYIDWIGISVYGPQTKDEGWWSFESILDEEWSEISTISSVGKPIAILEWGVIDYPNQGNKAQWITDAINSISVGGKYYKKIKAISYWHESFGETNLKINSSPESLAAYKEAVGSSSLFISVPSFAEN